MEEADGVAKDVAAEGEAVEDLDVVAVEEFAAELEGMLAVDEGEVVLGVEMVEDLQVESCRKPWEEGLAEAEGREEADASIGDCGAVDG